MGSVMGCMRVMGLECTIVTTPKLLKKTKPPETILIGKT